MRPRSGFTLIEIILSIGLVSLLAAISIPLYQTFQVRNDLDIAAVTEVQNLRRAQLLAQAVDGDTNWGVYATSGSITLFQGLSYATRATTSDDVVSVPTSITPTGTLEMVFTKFTGLPQASTTVIFNSSVNETRTISINAKGTISY